MFLNKISLFGDIFRNPLPAMPHVYVVHLPFSSCARGCLKFGINLAVMVRTFIAPKPISGGALDVSGQQTRGYK